MSEARFKVGDKVRVVRLEDGEYTDSPRGRGLGKIGTVRDVQSRTKKGVKTPAYALKELGVGYVYFEYELGPVSFLPDELFEV